jgi:rod shape-determining protein MreD
MHYGIGLKISKFLKLWKQDGIFFYPLIWLTCGFFIILRGSINHFLRIEWLDLDIVPIFLIYLVAKDQDYKASCLAFFMGILTDIFSPCQLGLFAFTYSAILLGVNHCRRFLDLNNIKTSMLLVVFFLLAKWSFLLIIVRFLPIRQFIALTPFVFLSVSIVITSLITPLLFYFLYLLRGKESQDRAQKGSLAYL